MKYSNRLRLLAALVLLVGLALPLSYLPDQIVSENHSSLEDALSDPAARRPWPVYVWEIYSEPSVFADPGNYLPLIILVWPFPVTAWLLAGPRRRVRTTIRVFEALLLSYPTVLIFVNLYWLVYGERERGWVWMVPGEGMVVIGAAFLCYGCA